MATVALNFTPAELRCLSTLAAYEVRYLVVGGFAVRFHGHLRPTKDLDVLVSNNAENAVRLCRALTSLIGIQHQNLRPEQIEGRKRQINLNEWGHELEVLTAADGINFGHAYECRASTTIGLLDVPIISKRDLIVMKRRAARQQDIADANALEAL